jgi:hypothetical protein
VRRTPAPAQVTVLVEALPANQSDVVQTLEEAVGIVREIGSPAIQTMFDVHNAIDEKAARRAGGALVRLHPPRPRERAGRAPLRGRRLRLQAGAGGPAAPRVRGMGIAGSFRLYPGAERLAAESLRHLESEIAKLPI